MTVQTALQLRPYQTEAVATIFREADIGINRQLVVLPTGAGKTAVAVSFLKEWHERTEGQLTNNRRILWLSHRDELIQQTVRAIELWWPEASLDIGIVKAERNQNTADIVIASIQTLAVERRCDDLIQTQDTYGTFGVVISDEHHHSPSPTWAGVLDALGCGQPDGPLMVGLTATPDRADGVGLKATTDKIVVDLDIVWAIANGYLVPPKGITVDVDLSTVKTSGGDYQAGSLGDVLELEGAHAAVAELVTRYASDRKTIIFTPTVRFAELVTAECVLAGHVAEMVTGETPIPDRKATYRRLQHGTTKIIVNVGVLTEGFDEPSVDCVIVARPTKSRSLFTQMVGRGLRLYPEKSSCLVVALAGTERNKLATLASLAGRTWEQAMKAAELATQGEFDFASQFDRIVEEQAKRAGMKVRAVDLLTMVRKRITWAIIGDSVFAKKLTSGDRDSKAPEPVLVVKQSPDETWRVVEMVPHRNRAGFADYNPRPLLHGVEFDTAQAFADDYVRRVVPNTLLDTKAPWRVLPASDKQHELLVKNRVPNVPNNVTRGQASDLLDVVFLRRIANRA